MSAQQARESVFRRKRFRDRYQKTNQFVAVALTDGYRLTQLESDQQMPAASFAERYGDSVTAGRPGRGAREAFRGRIIGEFSPHSYLDNPCDLAETTAPGYTSGLILQHTEFLLTEDYYNSTSKQTINRNDRVVVFLNPGTNNTPFDLERGWCVGVSRAGKLIKKKGDKTLDCTTLQEIMEGAAAATVASSTSTAASAEVDAAYAAFWAAIKSFMPTGTRISSTSRTIEQGSNMVGRWKSNFPDCTDCDKCTHEDMSRDQTMCLVDATNASGYNVAYPWRSFHCVGAGCDNGGQGQAFDLAGADINAISEGLTAFYNDTSDAGYKQLVDAGTIQPFFESPFTVGGADGLKHTGGWHVENVNDAVHVEIKTPQSSPPT